MYKYTFKGYLAGMFAVIMLFCGPISFAQAELVSNEQVNIQGNKVLFAIVDTLEEHIKFMQMILIQKLEARVTHLQALAGKK